MTTVHIARLNCGAQDGEGRFHIIVGVFSSRKLAEESLENFIEGTLEIEYPNVTVKSQLVEEFQLDQPIDRDPTALNVMFPESKPVS